MWNEEREGDKKIISNVEKNDKIIQKWIKVFIGVAFILYVININKIVVSMLMINPWSIVIVLFIIPS